jgi:hypothetical protein
MEAKKTDEIICTNCGRPNLAEAEKCWYCQTPLVKEESTGMDDSDAADTPLDANPQPAHKEPAQAPENEEDIPEWLKRVRELKAQDFPEEEETDQWQQQGLFVGEEQKPPVKPAQKAPKAEGEPSKVKEKSGKAEKIEEPAQGAPQPALDIQPKSEAQKEEDVQEIEENEEPPSEDLPDGFIQFRPKNH